MTIRLFFGMILSALTMSGCTTVYYNIWETLGKEKRDLLRDNIVKAKEQQKDTSEQFKDALTQLKTVYQVKGSKELEKAYDRASSEYERSEAKAKELHERVERVDQIAADLFTEWQKESSEIQDAKLRADSRKKLAETKERFARMSDAMHKADKSTEPVLERFKDNVLYLKHNLNAQAISGLSGEIADIEKSIATLVVAMNAAIEESNRFISTSLGD